jgi:hypothetical protein
MRDVRHHSRRIGAKRPPCRLIGVVEPLLFASRIVRDGDPLSTFEQATLKVGKRNVRDRVAAIQQPLVFQRFGPIPHVA